MTTQTINTAKDFTLKNMLGFSFFLIFFSIFISAAFADFPLDAADEKAKEVVTWATTKLVVIIGSIGLLIAGGAFVMGKVQWTFLITVILSIIGIASISGFVEWLVAIAG
jgi:type IV secretory pathway VirB2 component (pilin)